MFNWSYFVTWICAELNGKPTGGRAPQFPYIVLRHKPAPIQGYPNFHRFLLMDVRPLLMMVAFSILMLLAVIITILTLGMPHFLALTFFVCAFISPYVLMAKAGHTWVKDFDREQ